MSLLRRLGYASLLLAFGHIVFGAIVRITGSGMGCGDSWPTCHGYLFPPLERPDLIIEVTHRYIAAGLTATLLALLGVAYARRREAGIGGAGGVLRAAALSVALVLTAAILGGLVVKLELTNKYVIVLHLLLAMSLIAALASVIMRAGGLGAARVGPGSGSAKTLRAATAAAGLALVAVALGGLTAHLPGANLACVGFPHCPRGMVSEAGGGLHVHLTHRVIAFLLLFHLIGLTIGVARRTESAAVVRAARLTLATVVLQILVAAAMVEMLLPPWLRSLHQALGTLVWLATFVLAALAYRASRGAALPAPGAVDEPLPSSGRIEVRSTTPSASAMPVVAADAGTDAPEGPAAVVPPLPAPRPHSIAVIVARGADF